MSNELIPYQQSPPPTRRGTGKPALDVNRLVRIANKKDTNLDVLYERRMSEPLDAVQLIAAAGFGGVTAIVGGLVAVAITVQLGATLAMAGAFGGLIGLLIGLLVSVVVVGLELDSNASSELVTVASVSSEAMLQATAEADTTCTTAVGGWVPDWQALPIDIKERPHVLIVGSTGAGKSITLNALATRLHQNHPSAKWLICDYGGAEWKQAQAKSAEGIANTLIGLSELVQSRLGDFDGKVNEAARLFVILEEFESVLDDLKLLDSKLGKAALIAARDVSRRGRKVGIHLIVVVQSGKANTLDTAVRNNLDMRFVMRSPATVQKSLEVSADMTTAGRGEAWCNEVDCVVNVPYTRQPNLPLHGALGVVVADTTQEPRAVPADTVVDVTEPLGTAFFSRAGTDTAKSDKMPDMDILAAIAALESVPEPATLATMVRMVKEGQSANAIHNEVGGNRSQVLAQIRQLKEVLDNE